MGRNGENFVELRGLDFGSASAYEPDSSGGEELSDSCPEAAALVEHFQEIGGSSSENSDIDPLILENIDDFSLECGSSRVSITLLPICIGEEIVYQPGVDGREVYLLGRTVSESRKIRVLAEKWQLQLQANFEPRFLVKTSCGWVWAQRPTYAYRRVMNDGFTLAHFLHYVTRNPSSSATSTKEYLVNEFRMFGERPFLDKLPDFYIIIKKFLELSMEITKASVLREFFPSHFGDAVTSSTVTEETKGLWQADDEVARKGISLDLSKTTFDQEAVGAECTSDFKSVERKPTVHSDLRNLHSQWCTLLTPRKGTPKRISQTCTSKVNQPSKKTSRSKAKRPSQSKSASRKTQQSQKPASKETSSTSQKPSTTKKPSPPQKPAAKETGRLQRPSSSKMNRLLGNENPESAVPLVHLKTTPKLKKQKKVKEIEDMDELQNFTEQATGLRRLKKALSSSVAESSKYSRGPREWGVHDPLNDPFAQQIDPPICAICDDGGDLICCEGPCQRHFHATTADDTNCQTLGLTEDQVKRIGQYYCKNCTKYQHQCFLCEELGSSDPTPNGRQQVYICDAPGCKKFYHLNCVVKVLYPENDRRALAERIQRGLHGFLCPRHFCAACDAQEEQLGRFVQCRRCPKAWHRDCLTNFKFSRELPDISIWKHYDREFVYCKQHKIVPGIEAPVQDHVRFPE